MRRQKDSKAPLVASEAPSTARGVELNGNTAVPNGVADDVSEASTAVPSTRNEHGRPGDAALEEGLPVTGSDLARGGIDLEWRDLRCFVSEPKDPRWYESWFGLQPAPGPPTKQILQSSSGFARSGEVLAMMGPSGSGKTTLLNVLAQRPTLGDKGYWDGELRLNGAPPWSHWERDMAYVMQKDIFYDELKVEENLLTTAMLRLPYQWAKSRKLQCLDTVLADLGLEKVRGTKIGTAIERGLSGGEVKRASIANETLAMPRIFLLDEPLTGLDSSRAVDVMTSLRRQARENGTTVMLTIHQPSSSLYQCFDRLLLMGPGGRTAFFGDVDDAVAHFSKLGHPLPELWAPSDHFIELLVNTGSCKHVCDEWDKLREAGKVPESPSLKPRPDSLAPMPPLTYQVKVLLPRAFMRIQRSYLKTMNWKFHSAISAVFGIIYFQVGSDIVNRPTDFVGALFFIIAHWSWTPLFQGLGNFPKEKEMLTKERSSRVYDISAFFLSQVIAEAPLLLVFPAVFFVIFWPLTALPLSVMVQVFLLVALNIQVCSSMSMFISAVCMDQDTAVSTAIVFMVLEMCAGGYFANMKLLPWWIGWVRFFSNYFYSFGAVLRMLAPHIDPEAVSRYSFSDLGYTSEILLLLLMCVFFRVVAYVKLRTSKKLKFS